MGVGVEWATLQRGSRPCDALESSRVLPSPSLSLPLFPGVSLPLYLRYFPSVSVGASLGLPLSAPVIRAHSRPVYDENWLLRSRLALGPSGARTALPRALPTLGKATCACGFPKRARLSLWPSREFLPLMLGGARSPRYRLSPSADRLGGPPAARGTDRLQLRAEPQR